MGGNHAFFQAIAFFCFENFYAAHYIFPVTSPVSKTFAYLALVFRAHYVICRYMFTAGFQYNFRQITARFSAGRRKQVVVSDMLLFCCSWFKYRFTKLDLVTVGKFCFHFRRVRDSVVDCVNVNPSARVELNHGLRDAQNVCALTKVGTVLRYAVVIRKF